MKKSILSKHDWFFYEIVPSKHCPVKDIRILKHEYSLPEFIRLKEYVAIMDSMDRAYHKDEKLKEKQK